MSKRQHLSRLAAPRTWPIKRKGIKWIAKPDPGPHDLNSSMPIIIYLRDILKLVSREKNAKRLVSQRQVFVNSKPVREKNLPVGLFDVISIPKINKHYRVVFNTRGKFGVIEIPAEQANKILLKVEGKTIVRGKTQLNFSNGWNFIIEKDGYKKDDVLLFDTAKREITKHLPLDKGKIVFVAAGSHSGRIATLANIKVEGILKKRKIAVLKSGEESWQGDLSQVFVIGENEPEVKLQ